MIVTKNRTILDGFELKNNHLTAKKHKYESIAISNQLPIIWHKAKDFNVYDQSGNKWIDMTSGIFVANAGHSNPQVNNAIKAQLDKDMSFAFLYNTEIRYEFIEKLLEISPNHFEKAVLLNSGSEITDVAAKLIKFWAKKNNRKYIVVFEGSYHGRTLGADFICGTTNSTNWSGIKDENIIFIKFPYNDEKFDPSILPNPDEIAAFFLETYQGWGACMYPDHYMKDLYTFARQAGALVCFDEVQAGFYRMGELYGYTTYGDYIKPDLICLGKGISSSLPMSALLGTKEIIDVDFEAKVGGTHSGNALCCAAAMANIDFLTNSEFQEGLKERVKLFESLSRALLKFKSVAKINCKGMVTGIIFHDEPTATRVVKECAQNGVLPVYTFKNSIKLGPPLTITKDAIKEALGVISECIQRVENEHN
jgi:4-aminobutyrate aminotransferase/(S)-3-amino-2-methylpropionate transaminase